MILCTSYKSGTNWTQRIRFELAHGGREGAPEAQTVEVWPEARFMGIEVETLRQWLAGIEGPRLLTTHLPLDGLPRDDWIRYLVIARDRRDVFLSLYNHHREYTDLAYSALNDAPGRVGDPMPRCHDDPRDFWREWMTRGWFEWESEGYPFWSNLRHTATFWPHREHPNFLFLHYNDMLADLPSAVRCIAHFSGFDVDEAEIDRVADVTTFRSMKQEADEKEKEAPKEGRFFASGPAAFFYKGTNGRWRDVLTDADLALYETTKERVLPPGAADWLENGGNPQST